MHTCIAQMRAHMLLKCEHVHCSNVSMCIAQMRACILYHIAQIKACSLPKWRHTNVYCSKRASILLKCEYAYFSNVSMHIAQIIWAYMLLKFIAKIDQAHIFESICIVPFWDSVFLACCLWGTVSRSLNLVEIIWNLSCSLLVCRDLVRLTYHCLKRVICHKSL